MKKILTLITLTALLLCMSASAYAQVGKVTVAPTKAPVKAPAGNSLVQIAGTQDNLKTFNSLVDKAGLKDTLSSGGPYTILAPTDDAFAKLPPGALNLLQSNNALLVAFVKSHVVQGRYGATDLLSAKNVMTMDGKPLQILPRQGFVVVNGAQIVKEDIAASNGYIQEVDSLVVPK